MRNERFSDQVWPELALMAERVREARIERGLTQAALANLLKADRAWITNLENKKIAPRLESLICIARALDKPLGYFFAIPAATAKH